MEYKRWYIVTFLVIVISVPAIIVSVDLMDEQKSKPDAIKWQCGTTDYIVFKLNIFEKGYDILEFGPFMDGDAPVEGINCTIDFYDFNMTSITDNSGRAFFNFTFPIEYGKYPMTLRKDDIEIEIAVFIGVSNVNESTISDIPNIHSISVEYYKPMEVNITVYVDNELTLNLTNIAFTTSRLIFEINELNDKNEYYVEVWEKNLNLYSNETVVFGGDKSILIYISQDSIFII